MKKMTYTVTYHSTTNYGQFLQAYALQKIIGCNEIINFLPSFIYNIGSDGRKKLPLIWPIVAFLRELKKTRKVFCENDKLLFTKKFHFIKELHFFDNDSVTLIAGSDQIWNVCPILKDYFFLNFGGKNSKRISYAASLGLKRWPKNFECLTIPLLKNFNAISVREESAAEYLKSIGFSNVVCVCDPTLLYKGDFYRQEFNYSQDVENKSFIYLIRETLPDAVLTVLPQKIKIVNLKKTKSLVSVSEWLSLIDNSEYIVTDSFHCTVFSILFHKQFIVIPNHSFEEGMNERFSTLLGKTYLEYRCLNGLETSDEVMEKLNTPIDWLAVDQILEQWRNFSLNWLKKALEK